MGVERQYARLSDTEIQEIQRKAREKLGECRKTQDIIGQQVFSILGLYSRVIYYPLGKEGPWGITYMSGMESTISIEKPFVAINTSIPIDAQVFAAAHELYHIWYDQKAEALSPSIIDEIEEQGRQPDVSEIKASRFAAEFLVYEDLLHSELKLYSITSENITVKNILMLASLFTVPYQTMVKRLCETKVISWEKCNEYLKISESIINQLRKRFSIPIPERDGRIALDNLVELAGAVFEKKQISFEKLEFLLSMSGLKPADIGISEPDTFVPPSDDELDDIMEE